MYSESLFNATTWILPVVLAVTLHEAAHGFVAERFGDNTAKSQGRVTLNPIKHIDPMGTIIVPGLLLLAQSPMLFGYAKPVPVDFNRLNPLRFGMLAVAAAGPLTNIILAVISSLLLLVFSDATEKNISWVELNLYHSLIINCALAIFNMIPVLPLDGGRVLRALLPGEIGDRYAKTERYGMVIIIGTLLLPPLLGVSHVLRVLGGINNFIITNILLLTGHSIN